MLGRCRANPERSLRGRERLVQHDAAGHDSALQPGKQIALQITRDDDEIEVRGGERMLREIGAPAAQAHARGRGRGNGVAHRVEPHVDGERHVPGARDRDRVASASGGDVEGSPSIRAGALLAREALEPFDHERRRCHNLSLVAQALLTAVFAGFTGLVATAVLGLRGGDVSRHISFGIFSTLMTLLAHSMMMFYLIGKGKAVKDAMAEHGVAGDYYRRIASARKPVFGVATLAMAVTMTAAILGASVDTGVLPPIVHATIAYGAIVCNAAAGKIEIAALVQSTRIVDEVNARLGAGGSGLAGS